MFKDSEPGNVDINIERTEEALKLNPNKIITACPFCLTMLSDGIKETEKQDKLEATDIAVLLNRSVK